MLGDVFAATNLLVVQICVFCTWYCVQLVQVVPVIVGCYGLVSNFSMMRMRQLLSLRRAAVAPQIVSVTLWLLNGVRYAALPHATELGLSVARFERVAC